MMFTQNMSYYMVVFGNLATMFHPYPRQSLDDNFLGP